ncbi:hypothetical protein [Leptospira kirschneri]|nr:hypothetical protein [Leptospira kirschneri]
MGYWVFLIFVKAGFLDITHLYRIEHLNIYPEVPFYVNSIKSDAKAIEA